MGTSSTKRSQMRSCGMSCVEIQSLLGQLTHEEVAKLLHRALPEAFQRHDHLFEHLHHWHIDLSDVPLPLTCAAIFSGTSTDLQDLHASLEKHLRVRHVELHVSSLGGCLLAPWSAVIGVQLQETSVSGMVEHHGQDCSDRLLTASSVFAPFAAMQLAFAAMRFRHARAPFAMTSCQGSVKCRRYNKTKTLCGPKRNTFRPKWHICNKRPLAFYRIGSTLNSIIPEAGRRISEHWCHVQWNMASTGKAYHTQETLSARTEPVLQLYVWFSSGFHRLSCSGTSSELQELEPQEPSTK